MKTRSLDEMWEDLQTHIEWAEKFWVGFVFTDADAQASRLAKRLTDARWHVFRPQAPEDVSDVLAALAKPMPPDALVWIDLVQHDPPGDDAWDRAWRTLLARLNQFREQLRSRLPQGGVMLLTTNERAVSTPGNAPDLWSIRSLLFWLEPPVGDGDGMLRLASNARGYRGEPPVDLELALDAVRLADSPIARAGALERLAQAYASAVPQVAEPDAAIDAMQAALSIYQSLGQQEARANALLELGVLLSKQGQTEDAVESLTESIEIWRSLAEEGQERFPIELSGALIILGTQAMILGDPEWASSLTDEAIAILRELSQGALPLLSVALSRQGQYLGQLGLVDAAVQVTSESVAIARPLFKDNPETGPQLVDALMNFALTLNLAGRRDDALIHLTDVLEMYAARMSPDGPLSVSGFARALHNLALVLRGAGRLSEALKAATDSLYYYRQLASDDSNAFVLMFARAVAHYGVILAAIGSLDEAAAAMAEALDLIWPQFLKNPQANRLLVSQIVEECIRYSQGSPSEELLERQALLVSLSAQGD